MVKTGKDSKAYWFIESTWGWKQGDPNEDLQIAFNPMEKITVPKPTYSQKQIRTSDSQEFSFSFSELEQVGEGEFEGIYRDPFLMLAGFDKKTVETPWTGTDNVITGDFTADTHRDSIGMNYLKKDSEAGGSDLERSLLGGEITSIGLRCEAGDLVREVVGVKFATRSTGYKAFSTVPAFDDGLWSRWNNYAHNGYHSTQVTLKFGGTGMGSLGFKWKSFDYKSLIEKIQEHVGSSKTVDIRYPGNREHTLSMVGKFTDNTLMLELEKDEDDRAHGDIEIILTDDNANETIWKFTNAILDLADNYDIPAAAEGKESTLSFKGTRKPVLTLSGTFDEPDDPDAYITN